MSYTSIVEMAGSVALRDRIAAAAAAEPGFEGDPSTWALQNLLRVCAHDAAWQSAWQYVKETMTINDNPDIGARDDVISDAMILSAVQAVRPPAPVEPEPEPEPDPEP